MPPSGEVDEGRARPFPARETAAAGTRRPAPRSPTGRPPRGTGNALRAITRQRASSGARAARAARMPVSVVMSAMRENSAIRRRPTRLPLGQTPIGRSVLFYSRAALAYPVHTKNSGRGLMYRATKDIILPTTITGSLPRPSWYTENLGTRHFLEAMVSRRFREQYEDALTCFLRDQELAGLDIVTDGDCRFDDDVGGQSWTAYPPNHMSGFDHRPSGADAGRARRRLVSARPHPARLSGIARHAGDHRPDRPRQSAIHRDVEGGAALHRAAGEIRRGVGGDHLLRAAGPPLQEHAGPHVRHRRGAQRGISRARRRRLPGDPDRGAADPSDRGAQDPGRRHQSAS